MHGRYGPLALRVSLGIIFAAHGWPKLFGQTQAFAAKFAALGLPLPHLLVVLVGSAELVGAAGLLLGLCTRAAATLLAGVMAGAILLVKGKLGLVNGFEFDLVLLAGALSLLLTGPGAVSLEAKMKAPPSV